MTNTPTPGQSPNTGDTYDIEAPTDQWGETHQDLDKYPEGSAAREGKTTAPSGQGGKTPHDGTSYQDQFPPNPEPDDATKAWGEYLEKKEKGEDVEPPFSVRPAPAKAKSEPTKTTTTKSSTAAAP